MDGSVNIHGTAISVGAYGVLLRGPSGAGKSDLALRAMALRPGPLVPHQPLLVADDRVIVTPRGEALWLSCPETLRGLIEVRGVGIVSVPFTQEVELALTVDLVPGDEVVRMPEVSETTIVCGRSVRRLALAAFEPSAPLKLVLALTQGAAARA